MIITMRALLLVDIQNDFMPFGALPVPDGDDVVAVANSLSPRFDFVVASQDWHPATHASFASNHPGRAAGETVELDGIPQVLWADHCVQNSPGASFHSALNVVPINAVVCKGTDPAIDSYSAFFDNGHHRATGLSEMLATRGVTEIWLVGLATDYCVKYTALDARAVGLGVVVVRDGVRAVDLRPGDGERTLEELVEAGCRIVDSSAVPDAG